MWEHVSMPIYGGQDNLECHSSDTIVFILLLFETGLLQACSFQSCPGWLADESQRAPRDPFISVSPAWYYGHIQPQQIYY